MGRSLVVGSETFDYPNNNEDPGYGEQASDWANAITDILSSLTSAYDILDTTASLTNNQSSAASVTGLSFSSTVTRSFIIDYTVYRYADTNTITAYADGSGGKVVVTMAAHGLSDGNTVVISGSTNYNGTFVISDVTTNTFEITDTWVADDAAGTYKAYSRESGKILGVYDGISAWIFTNEYNGNAGVDFNVTTAGQVQYFTTSIAGSNYTGTIKFRAKTIDV